MNQLAPAQNDGILKALPFSKYSGPNFVRRNLSNKLSLIVGLGSNESQTSIYYTNSKRPVGFFSDASQDMAKKTFLLELKCSQAFECFSMADHHLVELLAFNFATKLLPIEEFHKALTFLLLQF